MSHKNPDPVAISNLVYFITFSTQLDETSPKSEGMNAIQKWIIFCIVMVFLALLEYGLILWMRCNRNHCFTNKPINNLNTTEKHLVNKERSRSAKSIKTATNKWMVDNYDSHLRENIHSSQYMEEQNETSNEKLLDKISIIIFPTSFIAFNIWYWIAFM